jgi:hypothetical protein
MPTEALIAHVMVAKYADHLPLYRQAQIYARQGVTLDRSTLSDWVGRAAWWLTPLRDHLLATLQRSPKLFADETTVPVLDPGRGRTKTGQLWADLLPVFWTVLSWKIPVMIGGQGSGANDEEVEIQRGADRVCVEAGRGWHDGWRGVSQDRDQRGDVLCVAEEVCGADAV